MGKKSLKSEGVSMVMALVMMMMKFEDLSQVCLGRLTPRPRDRILGMQGPK